MGPPDPRAHQCQAKNFISLLFLGPFELCLYERKWKWKSFLFFVTKGSRTLSCALEPEASTTKSPSNGLTFRWAVCSIDQLWYLCTWLSFSLYADQLWNITGMEPSPPPCSSWACGPRGAGSLGQLGAPSNLLPNSRKVKSAKDLLSHRHTFYNCTFDTKALLWIRVSTPVKELKDPSLTKGSWFCIITIWEVVVMVEEEVIKVSRNNAKPLTSCNFALLWYLLLRERWLG